MRFHGSHDLSVELLFRHAGTLHPDISFPTTFVGSLAGMVALGTREADLTGAHLLDEETGEFNVPFIKRLMPNDNVVLLNLVQRIQGLIVPQHNPKQILGIKDLSRQDITFVNRQSGSGTRILLDSQLRKNGLSAKQVKGYNREETTHVGVAGVVARGEADVGLGAQSAATVAGLGFIPLFKERYDLIMLQEDMEKPPLNIVPEIVNSASFKSMLGELPGYDISDTGKITLVSPTAK